VIIVTGGAVRLTGSGLGCPNWPNCEPGHLAPHGERGGHATIEWLNRLFTGLVSVAVILSVLGSLVRRPRRRDLTWLSVGLVAGVLAQIVVGGLAVLHGLAPPFVMAHFLLSLVLVADAVVLHHRAGEPGDTSRRPSTRPTVAREVRTLGAWLLVAAGTVFFTGTVVTGAGPHGGDENVKRLTFFVPDVARVHGIAVNLFVAATLLMMWLLHRTRAPSHVVRLARILLAVEVAQAAVGYTQYFTGVPEALVAVHILGAVLVWIAALTLVLSFRTVATGEDPSAAPPARVRDAVPA
jgi:cytochrome c oxidase assembly protein subunit 15